MSCFTLWCAALRISRVVDFFLLLWHFIDLFYFSTSCFTLWCAALRISRVVDFFLLLWHFISAFVVGAGVQQIRKKSGIVWSSLTVFASNCVLCVVCYVLLFVSIWCCVFLLLFIFVCCFFSCLFLAFFFFFLLCFFGFCLDSCPQPSYIWRGIGQKIYLQGLATWHVWRHHGNRPSVEVPPRPS